MPCDDILLHIQGYPDETPHRTIDAALAVARALSGRISGLAVELQVGYRPHLLLDHMLGLQDLAKETEAQSAGSCREGVDYFRKAAQEAAVLQDTETVSADMGLEALHRAREARCFDFSIYGPTAGGVDKVLAETLVLMSGRPLLILPDHHDGRLERAVVAWDGSPSAARAMNDALPVLQQARSVEVLTVDGDKGAEHASPQAHAVRHLQRRGVRARGSIVDPDGLSIATALERRLKAEQADVVVMGAFGHSRLREIVLGGVTEHMLSQTPVAVWLSH